MKLTLPVRSANRLKALLLILMSIFFFQKLYTGQLFYYIGPRFSWLSVVATLLFITLAQSYHRSRPKQEPDHDAEPFPHDHNHDGELASAWPLIIVAIPLLLGVIVPARPLDASAVPNRGVSTELTSAADVSNQVLSIIPSERNILDWVRAMSADSDPHALDGQEADVTGFVYRDIRFGDDQFMVARFTISCCVADATAIGIVVVAADALTYETNSWVRVEGVFQAGTLDDSSIPILVANRVEPVQPPEQPYLFP